MTDKDLYPSLNDMKESVPLSKAFPEEPDPHCVCWVGPLERVPKAADVGLGGWSLCTPDRPCVRPPDLFLSAPGSEDLLEAVLQRLGPAPVRCPAPSSMGNAPPETAPTKAARLHSLERGSKEPLPPELEEIVGESPVMLAFKHKLLKYARTDKTILLLGETGVGKDLAARVAHRLSPRSKGPFVAQNCAALPSSLAESELMGCVQGAFTGAVNRPGLLEAAQGGTLFLDEIGELGLDVQAKLLRVLDNGEFRRVGSLKLQRAEVRLIAATNRDLQDMVRQGLFREDLYYRLHGFTLRIPPLRERIDDIKLLVHRLYPQARLSDHAWQALRDHPWNGNVRELKALLEKALVEADEDLVEAWHLFA